MRFDHGSGACASAYWIETFKLPLTCFFQMISELMIWSSCLFLSMKVTVFELDAGLAPTGIVAPDLASGFLTHVVWRALSKCLSQGISPLTT
jgi:hypothetical protein